MTFDLTLNGFVRAANLLTLAFTPPFLAPTLCLLLAALAAGWRAFLPLRPPVRTERAIAFGKQRAGRQQLPALIRAAGRLHLLAAPYAAACPRAAGARAGAAARSRDAETTDAAIDRALARRHARRRCRLPRLPTRLAQARKAKDVDCRRAHDLHALERMLTR